MSIEQTRTSATETHPIFMAHLRSAFGEPEGPRLLKSVLEMFSRRGDSLLEFECLELFGCDDRRADGVEQILLDEPDIVFGKTLLDGGGGNLLVRPHETERDQRRRHVALVIRGKEFVHSFCLLSGLKNVNAAAAVCRFVPRSNADGIDNGGWAI